MISALARIEAKLDSALVRHDERIRNMEGEMTALRRIGTVIAVLWGTIVVGVAWLMNKVA